MQGGKGEKKITVMTKTMGKKPHLQVNTLADTEPVTKSAHLTLPNFAPEQNQLEPPKNISAVTTPKNFKPISETPEIEQTPKSKKKLDNPNPIQKRGSGKEVNSPKVQVQPRMSANMLTSPKAGSHKEKILISYGSEKNLNSIKPLQKKQTPQGKMVSRVEELQRLLGDQKARNSLLVSRESELSEALQKMKGENVLLQEENAELKKKLEKYKELNQDTKKMLKQRIHSFNEEGGEIQALRNHIKTLEDRVTGLLADNQSLKLEVNKLADSNLSCLKYEGGLGTSTIREASPLQGSRIKGLYLRESEQGGELKEFNGLENLQENLELESYITEKQQSYIDEYKANVDIFDKVKQEYEQIVAKMELRYKNLAEDYEQTIASQAGDIYELEDKLQRSARGEVGAKLSLGLDQLILRAQEEIAALNLALFELRSANKELVEEAQHHRAHCRLLEAALQVEVMKKEFRDQSHQFQSNVAKLNLLNIIDKLKIQVEREKNKYNKLLDKISPQP